MTRPRIAIAGFQHETNTFATGRTGLQDFEVADSWPRMLRGSEIIAGTRGLNLPIAGFIEAAGECDLVPILWCAAEPGGYVTDEAYDRIAGEIVEGIAGAGPLDGIYLDLHGAMVTETYQDGEGALLATIRGQVGADVPIAASLDLHANVTEAMIELADILTIYRTYPHLDMAEAGARVVPWLMDWLFGSRYHKAFRQVPYLIPLHAQYTGAEPCRGLYASLGNLKPGAEHAEIALGFTAADIHDVGPSVVAYAYNQKEADRIADALLAKMLTAEPTFDCTLFDPDEAVAVAMATVGTAVIADVQDNPGAGAGSDSTGLLKALSKARAEDALVGLVCDPETAARAHALGEGAVFDAQIGGRSDVPGDHSFSARVMVETLRTDPARFTGKMYGGGLAELGPSAVLRLEESTIRVVVTSLRSQCLDLGLLTHFGLDPAQARIIVVKSTVHYRADFEPIASRIINAAAPGLFPCRTGEIAYRNARTGLRRAPRR